MPGQMAVVIKAWFSCNAQPYPLPTLVSRISFLQRRTLPTYTYIIDLGASMVKWTGKWLR
jgi:hypothetical protein